MFYQFLRYNLVGIVNTIIGFSIIFGLMALGVSAVISNLVGYLIGAIVSYTLNVRFTFKDAPNSQFRAVKFFAVLFVAYLLNLAMLKLCLMFFVNAYVAQVVAGSVYTISSFLLAKALVFR